MNIQSKWARGFAANIQSGLLTEGQIRSARRIMANAANSQRWPNRTTKQCTPDEVEELLDLIREHKPDVTADQARKGANWLYSVNFTPRGKLRNTELAREFSDNDRQVIRELHASDTPAFQLVNLAEIGGNWVHFTPVYRAIGETMSFEYAAQAWQTGQPFVTSHAF